MDPNFDRITVAAKPRTVGITFAIDPNDIDRLDEAHEQVAKLRDRVAGARLQAVTNPESVVAADTLAAVTSELDQAEAALEQLEQTVPSYTLQVEQLPVKVIEKLRLDHRPTKQQKDDARTLAGDNRAVPDFNEDTYPPALITAAAVRIDYSDDPDHPTTAITVDMAAQLYGRWSQKNQVRVLKTIELLATEPTWMGDLGKG